MVGPTPAQDPTSRSPHGWCEVPAAGDVAVLTICGWSKDSKHPTGRGLSLPRSDDVEALGLWLLHRIHNGGHTAWSVMLTLSGLAVALGVVSFSLDTLPWWQVLVPSLLNGAEVVLLLTAPVREWTRARRPVAAHHRGRRACTLVTLQQDGA